MGAESGIEWLRGSDGRKGATWNPVSGCSPVSPGCAYCWAKGVAETRLAGRFGYPLEEPFRVTLHPDHLADPLRWKRPRSVFVVSMGDLFHEDVPFEYIAAIFGVMAACPWHTFIICTKRVKRALEFYEWIERGGGCLSDGAVVGDLFEHLVRVLNIVDLGALPDLSTPWPLPNLIVLTSVENQAMADVRIPLLLQIPAAVRGVSLEPMLGPVDMTPWLRCGGSRPAMDESGYDMIPGREPVALLDWLIVGSESGPGRRRMSLDWARSLRDQCGDAKVPFFLKQADDENGHLVKMPTLDGQVWAQMPEVSTR